MVEKKEKTSFSHSGVQGPYYKRCGRQSGRGHSDIVLLYSFLFFFYSLCSSNGKTCIFDKKEQQCVEYPSAYKQVGKSTCAHTERPCAHTRAFKSSFLEYSSGLAGVHIEVSKHSYTYSWVRNRDEERRNE